MGSSCKGRGERVKVEEGGRWGSEGEVGGGGRWGGLNPFSHSQFRFFFFSHFLYFKWSLWTNF